MRTPTNHPDVVLVGAGIMSATLAVILKELDPSLKIEIHEVLGSEAQESSNAWNNAGTGHAALCELNYTPEASDGRIDIAKALDEPVIADVAAYYAGQPQRNPNPATLAELPPAIVQLVELGDPHRNIPPCAACHRAGAGGPIETPVLAEQRSEYIVQQLKLYASGERRNDVYGRMRTIASRLTDAEIRGLAAYYRAGFR